MNDYSQVDFFARHLATLERTIAELEIRLKGFRDQLRSVKEWDLPEAVDSLEWDEERMTMDEEGDYVTVHLPDGLKVTVNNSFHPHITAETRPASVAWIKEHGGGSLLRTDFTLSFPRGATEEAAAVMVVVSPLLEKGTIEVNETIHNSTLGKFCRDKIAAGEELPDLLGLFHRRVATVEVADAEPIPARRVPAVREVEYP